MRPQSYPIRIDTTPQNQLNYLLTPVFGLVGEWGWQELSHDS